MKSTQPLVSVIIPVYKVEKYLEECVTSVCDQTYKNLEIILVDDGSPDNCGSMCDRYAAMDSRVCVVHQKNAGVAKARNTGLSLASGEFVFFVDSDDILMHHAIEVMMKKMQACDADMICGQFQTIDENSNSLKGDLGNWECDLCMDTEEALRYYTQKEWGPWNRLIRRSVHEGIWFPNYRIHEDEAIKFQLLERCRKVLQVNLVTYGYRQRNASITADNSGIDRMDMFYSRRENLHYLERKHPNLTDLFLPKVCEDALLNLGRLIGTACEAKDSRMQDILWFAREYCWKICCCDYTTKAQKLRFILIRYSNWNRKKCLYVRFYVRLEKMRGKHGRTR